MSTVSLIVPVYKRDWLPECLESIEKQTYKDIELIVIDDPEATGPWAARNRGLEKASGKFVAFCDADDYLETDAIELMVKSIPGVDMVAGSFRKFGAFEQTVNYKTGVLKPENIAAYAMKNLREPRRHQMLSGCWAKLYRRSMVRPFPSLATAEDMAFNFDYLSRCHSVRFIEEIVYNNRKHSGTASTAFDEKDRRGLFGFMEGIKYVKRFLYEFFSDDEIEDALDNAKAYHSMLYFMRIADQHGLSMRDTLMRLYP